MLKLQCSRETVRSLHQEPITQMAELSGRLDLHRSHAHDIEWWVKFQDISCSYTTRRAGLSLKLSSADIKQEDRLRKTRHGSPVLEI